MSLTAEEMRRLQREALQRTQQATTAQATAPTKPTLGEAVLGGTISGLTDLVSMPMDVPSAIATMTGVAEKPTQMAETLKGEAEKLTGIGTEVPEDDVGDVAFQAASGFIQGAPFGAPFGPLGVAAAGTAGAISNVILTRDFLDDSPLLQIGLGLLMPQGVGGKVKSLAPRRGFDPRRPVTAAEAQALQIGGQKAALQAVAGEGTASTVDALQKRSSLIERSLQADLGLLDGPPLTPAEVNSLGSKMQAKVNNLRASFSKAEDDLWGQIPNDINLPIQPIKNRLKEVYNSPKTLDTPRTLKATNLFMKRFDDRVSMSPKELQEQMRQLNDIGFGKVKFDESAFYNELVQSGNTELINTIKTMDASGQQSFFKIMALNMKEGIGDVAQVEGYRGDVARKLDNFKRQSDVHRQVLSRIENAPLYKFFGEDYFNLPASKVAEKMSQASKEELKMFSSLLRKTQPDAYVKLRRVAFEDFMSKYKIPGSESQGRVMYDFEKLGSEQAMKELRGNAFLSGSGDSVQLSKTLKAITDIRSKYDPKIVGVQSERTTAANQKLIDGTLQVLRSVAYETAIAAQGIKNIVIGVVARNPKTLGLFNNQELKLMERALKGENIKQEDALEIADKFEMYGSLLSAAPSVVTTSQAAQREVTRPPEAGRGGAPSAAEMRALQRSVTGSTPQAAEPMPIAP